MLEEYPFGKGCCFCRLDRICEVHRGALLEFVIEEDDEQSL